MRFEIYIASPNFKLQEGSEFNISDRVRKKYDEYWDIESKLNPHLFDGTLFYVNEFDSNKVRWVYSKYRYWYAQKNINTESLQGQLTSLAVTGIIKKGNQLLLGKRSAQVTQDKGLWDFVPSGGLSQQESGKADYYAQLKEEFQQELGVTDGLISTIEPLILVLDHEDKVLDIVCTLTVKCDLSHFEVTNSEYDDFQILNLSQIEDVEIDQLSPITQKIIEFIGSQIIKEYL